MQASDTSELQQTMETVLSEVRQLRHDVDTYKQEVIVYKQEVGTFNDKFENYQKATQWVVQLAFSLIAATTVTVVVSSVFNK
jgi:uncharacterized coiled-coil DUF342 family protein